MNDPKAPARHCAPVSHTAVELEAKDLPAYCPNPAMPLWSSHPRVFLDFGQDGVAKCPYCGTEYVLKPGTVMSHH